MHKHPHNSQLDVSIVGARGYSGLELSKLLLKHEAVKLTHCFATRDFKLSDDVMDESASKVACLKDDAVLRNLTDIVFLATPAEVSFELAPKILAAGKTVIDLSGAFRLEGEQAKSYYGLEAPEAYWPEYGLVPFCGAAAKGKLISNPGCYATAIEMALIPLLKHNLIETSGLVIDAKSGTTGAGRKASENLLYSEVEGQCLPYRVGKHQHAPEVQKYVKAFAGADVDPHFATHLLPVKRGLIASIYATAKTTNLTDIAQAFKAEYDGYPLVRHGETIDKLANLSKVVGTPYTHISYTLVGNKLYVFSSLDNLLKGAASQAVENMNRILDLPLAFSLTEKN